MVAQWIYYGPWMIPVAVKHVLCSDGKRRYARITASEPDTFFSIRASIQVRGKTVSGYVTGIETDGKQDSQFYAVQTGKNYTVLPN